MSQQPWGRGWSVIQNETADGLSGGKEEYMRAAGVPSNPQQTQADGVGEG